MIDAMSKPALDLSRFTADEKLDLVDLWRSLPTDDLRLSPEIRAELDRRLDRMEREGSIDVAWEDVRAEMITTEP
jgi:putative addiction module component (TIGR02574 family)